ncbi:MAG TPA: L,D-transpeptidase family protein [Nocardioidaceae bacterium]|nr:L,D-transpeptidase family protein [Nocardioidaceae bacterium]
MLLVPATVLLTVLVAFPAQAASTAAPAQRRLNTLGCAAGPADGTIGTWTRAAIVRFQAANRLEQKGSLTTATRSRLYAARPVRCDRRPVVASGKGRRIVVSQRQNYVWLVRAGGGVAAQGGMIDNPGVLRSGRYRTGSHCGRAGRVRDNRDPSGRLRLHNFVRFAPCGVGFHQVPQRRSDGTQIHSDRLLGTDYRASHGCLRVSRALSQRIWRFARPGTRVVVVRH